MNVLGIVKNVAIIVVGSVVAAALTVKAGELIDEVVSGNAETAPESSTDTVSE